MMYVSNGSIITIRYLKLRFGKVLMHVATYRYELLVNYFNYSGDISTMPVDLLLNRVL